MTAKVIFRPDNFADRSVNRDNYLVDRFGLIKIYVDGACIRNGKSGAQAGFAVWFNDNHPSNVCEQVNGRATNNTAEIQAAIRALQIAQAKGLKGVKIITDSQFLLNAVNSWMHSWRKNGWRKADGSSLANKSDFMDLDCEMDYYMENYGQLVFQWAKAHSDNKGNNIADQLARRAAQC